MKTKFKRGDWVETSNGVAARYWCKVTKAMAEKDNILNLGPRNNGHYVITKWGGPPAIPKRNGASMGPGCTYERVVRSRIAAVNKKEGL